MFHKVVVGEARCQIFLGYCVHEMAKNAEHSQKFSLVVDVCFLEDDV